jgi:uncharacterized protein (TIGR03067 family)
MKRKLPLLLAVGLLLAADAPKDDPGKKELDKIQGTWTTSSIEYNGKSFDDLAKDLQFVFKGDTATVEGNANVRKDYATLTFKLDPSVTPKQLDLTVKAGGQKDAVMQGIYELKGDELRLCVLVFGRDRPTEFAAPAGSVTALVVLKREKP